MKKRLLSLITTIAGALFILLGIFIATYGYLKYEEVKVILVVLLSAWGVILLFLKDPEWLKTVFEKLIAKQ